MIKPTDFLSLAEELSKDNGGQEAKLRTSISRSYYAAFHEVAKRYADLKNLKLSDSIFSNHQAFIRELQHNQSKKIIRTLGNQLYQLKKDRFKADYKLSQDVSRSAAQKSYFASKKIIYNSSQL